MVFKKVLAVMLASVAVGAFSGCDSKDAAAPVADSDVTEKTGDVTADDLGVEFDALQAKLLTETPPAFPEPVASKTALQGEDAPYAELVIEVYEVKAREDSTFVSWGVRSVKGDEDSTTFRLNMAGGALGLDESLPFTRRDYAKMSTTMVRLLDPETETTYWPWQRPVGGGDQFKGCLCSGSPEHINEEPYLINGLYPKLPDDLETVSFKIPHFPVIENVPVSRE